MSQTASSSHRQSSHRANEIRRVVFEVAREREQGRSVSDEEVIAEHADLLPEIREELRKLACIRQALEKASDAGEPVARDPLETPSSRGGQIGPETDDFLPGEEALHEVAEVLSTIGRYHVWGVLGEGGFARVYHATDEELQRDVAIKVPHVRRGTDPAEMDTYWVEARILAGLDHPAIVPVYDVGRTRDGHCYVVTKLIRGESLAARLARSRPAHADSVRVTMVVADALHYAHSNGLVHRDIKPANILLDALERPYVVDFGLALTQCDSRRGSSYAGTPGYMSPEQARGEAHRVDVRSDIFSLGVVLYEALTGQRPFQALSHDELLQQILWEDPLPPRHWDETVPAELERICLKALSKRAADRYASAADMADDLSHWLKQANDPRDEADAMVTRSRPDSLSGTPSAAQTPKIIPRGLRSFDAKDADYYLSLVPGPRDRDGLPESIRQWKTRIEEPEPAATFAVGLLYGPSGCGKSSLVRAGLLPRLSPKIRTIYVEASGDETPQQLRHRIGNQFPDFEPELSLAQCLTQLRRGRSLDRGEKLLLVIDQFEQWLHGRGERERRELLAALRQCDGQHVICLLLVRDDFWLAVGRFMAELEVELVQGHNAALVDLFDPQHARKVLAEFGRAFGQLPDDLHAIHPAQVAFLSRAVHALAQEDRVVPVRLALFAEMVKNRPWTSETLRVLGGAEGVGVAFLEETFSTRTANPRYRIHQGAIRAVLAALLPDRGSDIRGRFCSNSELLDISGYGHKPRQFQELMRILDGETRLLTPMDLDAIDTYELQTSPVHRYYQLTHDYLVPSLRQWLTAKQKSTRVGRMELRLAERARLWNDRPERRQLPSLVEWASIRLMTRKSQWTAPQQHVMRAAFRHYLRSFLSVASLLCIVLLAGGKVTGVARGLYSSVRARATVLQMALGQGSEVWPLLRPAEDPTQRTEVVHSFSSLVTSPNQVASSLQAQADVGIRRAMTLVVGELIGSLEQQSLRTSTFGPNDPLVPLLLQQFRNDPDPGLHSATRWTLQRYQKKAEIARIDGELQFNQPLGQRRWFVNEAGHTMAIIPGWTSFLMGAPPDEPGRAADERWHTRQIRHSFALASQETTVGQFNLFLRETGRPNRIEWDNKDLPRAEVSWFDAAAYCNWLSEKEGLPREQWCYLPDQAGNYGPGMRVANDFLNRLGYRLPTEAEWEFACRAGTTTARYFGNNPYWLSNYAIADSSDQVGLQVVSQCKPNDFGLFDMLGNVAEWCQDDYRQWDEQVGRNAAYDYASSVLIVQADTPRVVRGGSATDPADRLRSAARDKALPSTESATIGFRVARRHL